MIHPLFSPSYSRMTPFALLSLLFGWPCDVRHRVSSHPAPDPKMLQNLTAMQRSGAARSMHVMCYYHGMQYYTCAAEGYVQRCSASRLPTIKPTRPDVIPRRDCVINCPYKPMADTWER
jgi:hypothetical protein